MVFLMCNYGEEWAASSIFIQQINSGWVLYSTMNTGSGCCCQDGTNETCAALIELRTFVVVIVFVSNEQKSGIVKK